MPDLSKLDWPTISAVLVGVLALVGTIAAARIGRDSDRAIRSRIAKDVAVWKELPDGSKPKKQMFQLITKQVDALVAPATPLRAGDVLTTIAYPAIMAIMVYGVSQINAVGAWWNSQKDAQLVAWLPDWLFNFPTDMDPVLVVIFTVFMGLFALFYLVEWLLDFFKDGYIPARESRRRRRIGE